MEVAVWCYKLTITCHTSSAVGVALAKGRHGHLVDPRREMSEERDPSSDQFDALIELLASDDARDDSNFHIAPEGVTSSGLRDANGKLDYAKIRSLFLQRQANNDGDHTNPDALNHDPNSELELNPPLVSTNLMATETVYLVYFRLWWKNRQPWQETLYYPSLCHNEEISSLLKSRQSQRCVHCISHGTALGLNKPSKDGDVHHSQSVLPPEVTSPLPCQHISGCSFSVATGFRRLNSASFTS
jgi:hypothetical protein